MLFRCSILLVSFGVVASAVVLAPSVDRQDAGLTYEVVDNWPTLPDGFALGETTGVATDSRDRIYIFHRGKKRPILVFDRDGKLLRSWGDGLFKTAHGLTIDDADNIWVTDLGHHLVYKFSSKGELLLTLGTKDKPGLTETQFNKPADTAIDSDGNIYVADGYGNNRIVKFSKEGRYLTQWGKRGKANGEFHLPHGVLIHQGRVVVADRENDRVQIFSRDGKFLTVWKNPGAPFGLLPVDSGHWLLADGRAHSVNVLNTKGKPLGRFGKQGKQLGEFNLPHGICTDSTGAIYVTEIKGKRVQKFVPK